jgi:eukaryotic-like serine/threonine-protein kinase
MASLGTPPGLIRFGPFALDPTNRELRKRGYLVRLQPQQIAVLLLLINRAGQIVSREEIHHHIWGNDTFVDFERGINFSINQIRAALGDDADNPRFIETIPRRGYRFIAATAFEPMTSVDPQQAPALTIAPAPPAHFLKKTKRFLIAGAVLVFAAFAAVLWLRSRTAAPIEIKMQQLTHNSNDNPITSVAVSPDGKYFAYSDLGGLHIKLLQTGEVHDFPQPPELGKSRVQWFVSWLPDSTRFVAGAFGMGAPPSIWQASVVSGSLRVLRKDAVGWSGSVSPDGSQFAFTQANEQQLWLMGIQGDHLQKVADAGAKNWFSYIEWSPDGSRLLYIKRVPTADHVQNFMEMRDLKSGSTTTLLSGDTLRSVSWLHDGRVLYVESDPDTKGDTCRSWIARLDNEFARFSAKPRLLTQVNGFCISSASATADGKQLYFLKQTSEFSVYVSDLAPDATSISPPRHLTLVEGREFPAAWTADSREIVFVSNRESKWGFYRQSLNSTNARPILTGIATLGLNDIFPRVAPDGAWLVYAPYPADYVPWTPVDILKVPISGGSPQLIMTAAIYDTPRCARAPVTLCAVAIKSKDQLIVTGFDVVRGTRTELARLKIDDPDKVYTWDLSPDGTRIAMLKRGTSEIQIFSLRTHADHNFTVKGWDGLEALDWTSDGKGLFTSSTTAGSVLLHTDLQGNASVLWEPKGSNMTWAIPSCSDARLRLKQQYLEHEELLARAAPIPSKTGQRRIRPRSRLFVQVSPSRGRKTSFAFARPSPHQRDTHLHAVSSLLSLSYWS